jgi:hypothetical protein
VSELDIEREAATTECRCTRRLDWHTPYDHNEGDTVSEEVRRAAKVLFRSNMAGWRTREPRVWRMVLPFGVWQELRDRKADHAAAVAYPSGANWPADDEEYRSV